MRTILPGVVAPAALAMALGLGTGMARPAALAPKPLATPGKPRRGKGFAHAKRVTRLGGNHGR